MKQTANPEEGSASLKSINAAQLPLVEIAKVYENQVKKLKSENDRLHAIMQKPLISGDDLRDDELGTKLETFQSSIERLCRANTVKREKATNFDVQLKAMAVLGDHIHDSFFASPVFGLGYRSGEESLRKLEKDLIDKLGMYGNSEM